MNRTEDRSCKGKKRHAIGPHARIALRETIKETGDLSLRYYRCPHCKGFHVGHPSRGYQKILRYDRLLTLISRALDETEHHHQKRPQKSLGH